MAVTTALVVGSAYAANRSAAGARAQANASQRGTDLAVGEQQRQFDLTRSDQKPWMDAGIGALGRLTAASNGDYSSFQKAPDFQFTQDEAFKGLDRGAAARGRMFSGGADADRMRLVAGLASQEYGNWWNRQLGLSNGGQSTASNIGQMGMGMANNIGNMYMQNATNQGNAAAARTSAYGNAAGGLAGMYAGYKWGLYGNKPGGG
jgi:hypothetical protein